MIPSITVFSLYYIFKNKTSFLSPGHKSGLQCWAPQSEPVTVLRVAQKKFFWASLAALSYLFVCLFSNLYKVSNALSPYFALLYKM